MDRRTPLAAEIEQLLADARKAYADPKLEFTLVAIPYQPPVSIGRMQRCDKDSPDVGQIRDGAFYWPLLSFKHFGQATIGDLGPFVFMGFERGTDAMTVFAEFGGRAAAALLAASPAWFGVRSPGAAFTIWAATIIFGAPSARNYAVQQRTGPRILRNPWAASITALNDILSPPVTTPQPTPLTDAPPALVRGDESGGSLVPTVDENEFKVLTTLSDRHPVQLKNVDIEVATSLSKQTVGAVVARLIGKDLVERPQGKRKGATLTAKGERYLDRIRKSPADHP